MRIDDREIVHHCRDLWESMLGLRLERAEQETPTDSERILSSCLPVDGEWRGAILLRCPQSVARHAAVMLFEADDEKTTETDLREALNELTRMIGRRLQGQFPDSSRFATPRCLEDRDEQKELSAMKTLRELTLDCEGRPMCLSFLESEIDRT